MDGFSQPSHLALGQAERLFSFLSDDLSIRLEAATTLTRRDDRQRPVTVQPTSPPDTFRNFKNRSRLRYRLSHRSAGDSDYGGFYWGVGYGGPSDPTKQGYGHAVVLLAASSAKVAAHPGADRLLTDISTIIRERFWEVQYGAVAEEFTSEWQLFDNFRGQNPTCV